MRQRHRLPARQALALLLLLLVSAKARAGKDRFDVQEFRPFGAPQDLVMVAQSRPLSHLSFAAGTFFSFSLDPLSLVSTASGERTLSVVRNRLELDVMATIGLFRYVELGVVLPLVMFQSSGNLAAIGSEGFIRATVLGDLRLNGKIALPRLLRKPEGKGFGAAATFQLNFPTGSTAAFTSDGRVTVQPGVIADYRFKNGALVGLNAGVWVRPSLEFLNLRVGSSFAYALGGEVPIVRRWGLTVVGNFFGNVRIAPPAKSLREVTFEGLLGFRWYSSSGITLTVGGGGGGCGFGTPSIRFFASLIWVPARTREYAALERFKKPPEPDRDPDKDHVFGTRDRCPMEPGPEENDGCPDTDGDGDGVVDRLDKCPDEPARAGSPTGCPRVAIRQNKIAIIDQVHFATDQEIILPESNAILEEVAGVLKAHPEILRVLVEGHTDVRASDAYNLDLSERRAQAVMRFLIAQGVDAGRLHAQGFGRRRPIADNNTEAGMALNRRVEFTIEQVAGLPSGGTLPDASQVLPPGGTLLPKITKPKNVLPKRGVLRKSGAPHRVLPSKAGLPRSVLPHAKPARPPVKQGAR